MPAQTGTDQPVPGSPGMPGQGGNPALAMIGRILTIPPTLKRARLSGRGRQAARFPAAA